MTNELAVIIPAYKAKFLSHTLRSIEQQTCRRFNLYVGDDCGSPEIERIVAESAKRLAIRYHRFSENIGHRSLIQQWDRCINLSTEPWVWLFSDDDVMETECVQSFYSTIEKTNGFYDIYRFNTYVIDNYGTLIGIHPPLPEHETWAEYLYCMFKGWRITPLQSLVFSRKAYEQAGGFLDLPGGWGSDEVIQIALAGAKGIRLVSGPRVHFRQSRENISSQLQSRKNIRAQAIAQMALLRWCLEMIKQANQDEIPFGDAALRRAAKQYFREIVPNILRSGSPALWTQSFKFMRQAWHEAYWKIACTYCAGFWEAALAELRSMKKLLERLAR